MLLDKSKIGIRHYAGIIGRKEINRFRTLLFRQTRGKAFIYYKDFGDPNVNNKELLSLYVIQVEKSDYLE